MRLFNLGSGCCWLRLFGVCTITGLALCAMSCARKDGVIVELTDQLADSGAVVRDWRRSGMGVLDVQIFTATAVPGTAWTLAAYDKDGRLLTSGRVLGPQARDGDTVWLRLTMPQRDLFDKADRVVVGADPSAPVPPPALDKGRSDRR